MRAPNPREALHSASCFRRVTANVLAYSLFCLSPLMLERLFPQFSVATTTLLLVYALPVVSGDGYYRRTVLGWGTAQLEHLLEPLDRVKSPSDVATAVWGINKWCAHAIDNAVEGAIGLMLSAAEMVNRNEYVTTGHHYVAEAAQLIWQSSPVMEIRQSAVVREVVEATNFSLTHGDDLALNAIISFILKTSVAVTVAVNLPESPRFRVPSYFAIAPVLVASLLEGPFKTMRAAMREWQRERVHAQMGLGIGG